ncbi:DNA repair helicase XPB [Deinococcus malanensis]|uniref:DNA repair helicase XPB n=1 Tax=Deinococcus malanensis TaxID=1706855 RepID=UPI003635C871
MLKQQLIEVGWPVDDQAGYTDGAAFAVQLSATLQVRDYQQEAAEAFYRAGSEKGGSGVVVLAPGAGKTVVGMVAMSLVGQRTLVLTTNRTSINQWYRELLNKTDLSPEDVSEYAAGKALTPVTLCTYQMLTHRKRGSLSGDDGAYPHLALIGASEWGLIIYDEVHLLPAPVFRLTAEVQARRRLGLTATLIREDGREGDVFALIGPKRYDQPWKTLEAQGWIAQAHCLEVRLRLPPEERVQYAVAPDQDKHRIAAENPAKRTVLRQVMARHSGLPTLIIGQFLDQLELIGADLEVPVITGKTPQRTREDLFQAFREGRLKTLVLSKVGNFALDLPDAEVLIQVSGAFGSRQEEAQRLGRLLRPKADGRAAYFYSLVTRETSEEDFAHHRQLFLAAQGYSYGILDEDEV